MPFMDVHAGYRVNNLSYTQTPFETLGSPGDFQLTGSAPAGATDLDLGDGGGGCPDCVVSATLDERGEMESASSWRLASLGQFLHHGG